MTYYAVSLGPRFLLYMWPGSSFPVDSPQKKNYERLQKALDSVMSIREMTQVFCPLPVPCLPTQVPYSV